MTLHRPLALVLLCTLAWPAMAQWQWLDKDGRKVFSDRPPPSDVPVRNILRQPAGAPAAAVATTPAPAAAPANAAGQAAGALPKPTGRDPELEARKREADAAEAAKRKAEEERAARARADNCQRARQAQATLDSGIRIAQVNAQGERVFMDEAARAAETQRNQAVMASDCR
ncbi:DUF4124 domain-containing protein [uncultured Xylophilus sp.]|uniref:DUF4124 domain-containing protein n=1 Tax=uncultured Xylophilus sp. TaxID=296832 RepID=UPI0025DC3E6C|nr:DUF4124 domain-containing protein [uncultured Xylophilus sp.]